MTARSLRIINATAPIRLCDNGGWTDTWFARHGKIFNIGVCPGAEVQVEVHPRLARNERVVIHAENYGEQYAVQPDRAGWGRHPLLEAAIAHAQPPEHVAIRVTVFSHAPPGASTGTSAAVTVAILGALDRLTPGRSTPLQLAYAAHAVETELLKQQSGIQDQLCAAFGGINFIEVREYPHAVVSSVAVPDRVWWELEQRLVLIYLGKAHRSSAMHEEVIGRLQSLGPDCQPLNDLRLSAEQARDALSAGDFIAFGRSMRENTQAQRRLHPGLVARDALRVIEIARAHGALGWKVNGAGGEGGSVTLLSGPRSDARRAMIRTIEQEDAVFKNIPVSISRHGVRVWEREASAPPAFCQFPPAK